MHMHMPIHHTPSMQIKPQEQRFINHLACGVDTYESQLLKILLVVYDHSHFESRDIFVYTDNFFHDNRAYYYLIWSNLNRHLTDFYYLSILLSFSYRSKCHHVYCVVSQRLYLFIAVM